jgi:glycosyltransferase involved in cell wall biosynthesis
VTALRVAYVCADPGVPVFGTKGSSIHVQSVLRGFLRVGAKIDLFATRLDGTVPDDLITVRAHWLPALPKGDLAAREKASVGANRSLDAALRREGPFGLVYERYSLWSFAAMEYARETETRSVLEVNAPLVEEQERYRGLVDRSSAESVARRVFTAAGTIVAVSREVAEHIERCPGLSDGPHVVANGVDPLRFPAGIPPSHPAPPGTFTIGFVGSLKPWHGLEVLVDAFAALQRTHPETRLLVVGDGPERESLIARLAATDALEAAELVGAVDPGDVAGLLASMDMAVAPYPPQVGFYFSPLKLFEYMAAGRPVVASRIGQVGEIIQHGWNGLLCEPGDVASLVAGIERLRFDPLLAMALGANARASVLQHHTWDAAVRRILELAGLPAAGAEVPVATGL